MNRLTSPSPSDFDRWEQLIHDGVDPGDAARSLGFGGSSSFRRDKPRHAEAIGWWRDSRRQDDVEYTRTKLRLVAEDSIEHGDHMGANRALELIGKQAGMFDDRVAVEHGGQVEVTVQHDYPGILERLEQIGLLRTGPAAVVDAEAVAVLPARTDEASERRSRSA